MTGVEKVQPTDSYYENVSVELKKIVTEVMDSPSDEDTVIASELPPTDTDPPSCEYDWHFISHNYSECYLICLKNSFAIIA